MFRLPSAKQFQDSGHIYARTYQIGQISYIMFDTFMPGFTMFRLPSAKNILGQKTVAKNIVANTKQGKYHILCLTDLCQDSQCFGFLLQSIPRQWLRTYQIGQISYIMFDTFMPGFTMFRLLYAKHFKTVAKNISNRGNIIYYV